MVNRKDKLMETEKELLEALEENLLEEAQDLKSRADDLEWEELEKIFRAEGLDEEGLELEKQMFDSTMMICNMLDNYK